MGATNTIFPLPTHPRDDRLREIDVVGSEANQWRNGGQFRISAIYTVARVQSSGLTYKNHSQRGLQRCRISVGTSSGVAGRGFLNFPGWVVTTCKNMSLYTTAVYGVRGAQYTSRYSNCF